MDSNLLITDDVKSAFADLLGRKSRNVSDIKIQGKHISPKPNPVDTAKQRNVQIYNDDRIFNDFAMTSLQQNHQKNESSHSSTYSTPKQQAKPSSVSAATTPSRGSVLASYIQRFRNTPATNPYERKQDEDFWWIKNAKNKISQSQKQQQQKRPNTAPNTTYSANNHNHTNKQNENQVMVIKAGKNHSKQSSVRSSISDHAQLSNAMKSKSKRPKQIEYKQQHIASNESLQSSKHSSISSSPNKSIIDASDAKSEDSDVSDQEFNILHLHYDEETHGQLHNYMDTLQSTSNAIDFSLNDDEEPIDVDDILVKWRKNRRLKQLASENGMNADDFASHNNQNYMQHSSLFDDKYKDEELNRIKQRLGFDDDHIAPTAPTQPFTATIHPIPFPNQYSSNHRPSYHNNHSYHPSYQHPKPRS